MASTISHHICSAYVGETYVSSPYEIAKLRLSSSLSSNVRKPRKPSLNIPIDFGSRRVPRLSDTSLNRTVSVFCGTADDNNSSASSNSQPDGSQSRDGCEEDALPGLPAMWDLEQLKAVAARIGDPLRDILSSASQRWQAYLDSHNNMKAEHEEDKEHTEAEESIVLQQEEWDWERWQEHFLQTEEQEKSASNIKFQLESAIDMEDFKEAARLKGALREASGNDLVAEVLTDLKKAVDDESYETATRLRDEAAAGLLGWWAGLAKGENDPYGRIVNISSSYGRFVGRGYTARQLASASSGTPLFEVFVRKDHEGYHQQAVYLQQAGSGDSLFGSPTSIDVNIDVNIVDVNEMAEDGKEIKTKETLGDEKAKGGDTAVLDEGLNGIINFIKDRIPDVKLKVFRVISQNGEDIPKIVEQILEEVEAREGGEAVKGKKENESEGLNEALLQELKDKVGDGGGEPVREAQKEIPIRLIVGGTVQNAVEDKLPKVPARRQARIESQSRDLFVFHIEEVAEPLVKESLPGPRAVTATTTQDPQTELTPDISKVVDKIPVKVSKDMGELLKLAISQVQRRRGLSKCTSFERIKLSSSNADPMTGLYIGAFGPYTSELVQLKRKFGHWQEEADISNLQGTLGFFEYVEAVKLTGDLNVPAGQVTFRAKISKESRLSHRGIYPEELGVVARYKGQGRLAEPGFKNPQWVDGELLHLDGKGFGHLNGAELGFVYSVPERHFLVLFNRLNLMTE